jgi:hypothetical protein
MVKRGGEMRFEFWGHTPKTIGFFTIFGLDRASRQLRRSSEGAGFKRGIWLLCHRL